MAKFSISNQTSGENIGVCEGATAADAVDAMHRDAGYTGTANYLSTMDLDPETAFDDDLCVVEVLDCSAKGYADHVVWAMPSDGSMDEITDATALGEYFDAVAEIERDRGSFDEPGTSDDDDYLVPEGDVLAKARSLFVAKARAAAEERLSQDA